MARVLNTLDKTIKTYWQSFDIMKPINNIESAWNEVSNNCLNGLWRELFPSFVHNLEEGHQKKVIENISRLAQTVGFDDVTVEDGTQVLESHNEPLSNKDLEELVEELDHQHSKEEEKESEEESLRVIKTADLQHILSNIETLTDEPRDIDHDWDLSAKVEGSVIASIRPYTEFFNEKKRKRRKLMLDAFLKNENLKPGTSSLE
ncbi:hypothetical protein QE152_g36888 [Popillia japonica]|uniref:DDE-1 domain-containing protein n=1 Tax=Popillia japonica TaxID=7064 RepID=A0AAW1IB92_POPJA